MQRSMIDFIKSWKDQQSVEASVFCGDLCVAHFEFAIFSRRKNNEAYWRIASLDNAAEFFLRESMEMKIFFSRDRRPHMVISVA